MRTSSRSQITTTSKIEINRRDPSHRRPITTISDYRGIEGSKLSIVPTIMDTKKKWKHIGYCEVRHSKSIELHFSVPPNEETPDILR